MDELDLRASDAERDATVTELRRHLVDGRLTMEEFDERSGQALRARTRGDLMATLRELPTRAGPRRASAARRPERAERVSTSAPTVPAVLPALLPALVVVAIVALAAISRSWWLLWLIWPALAFTKGRHRSRYGHRYGYGGYGRGWSGCGGHRNRDWSDRSQVGDGYRIV